MIANERQYRTAKAERKRFEEALAAHDAAERDAEVDPRIHQAMRDATVSEISELCSQLDRYDDLRAGRIGHRVMDSLREFPIALIEARISAHLTQRDLADALGIPEQQVQRWEANTYHGVGLDRLQEIADVLQLEIHETVTYASRG